MAHVGLLPRPPRRLGRLVCVRAPDHGFSHRVPELRADLHQLPGSVVFNRVVEERRDRLFLGGAVLEDDTRGAQEMGQVRDRRALTDVAGVEPRGEDEGLVEALSEPWNVLRVGCLDFSAGGRTPFLFAEGRGDARALRRPPVA